MKINGKVAKYTVVAVIVVAVGVWGRGGELLNSGSSAEVAVVSPAILSEPSGARNAGEPNGVHSPLTSPITPERAKLVQTIDQLAAQLVELAPNQLEAANAAAEAKSLRIQRLRAERYEERSREAKAAYEAALFIAKTQHAGAEASNAVKTAATEEGGDKRSVYTVPFGRGDVGQAVSGKSDVKEQEKVKATEYVLRGILDDDNGAFRAIVEVGGKQLTVRKGFKFSDGGVVENVERYIVAIRKDGVLQQLQTF